MFYSVAAELVCTVGVCSSSLRPDVIERCYFAGATETVCAVDDSSVEDLGSVDLG